MSTRRGQAGFTLIEALVALAIVGLSSAVLFKVISDNLDRTRTARDEAVAMARVQSVMAQAQAGDLRPGTSDGAFGDGFAWHVEVSPDGAHAGWPVDAVRVAVTVSWRDGARTQARTLNALRVVPKAASQ